MNPKNSVDFAGKISIPRSAHKELVEVMQRARNMIRMLCKEADTIDTGNFVIFDQLIQLPAVYHCNGVEVRFIPGWGIYEIEGHNFRLPTSREKMHEDIAAVNSLKRRLAHPSNNRCKHDIILQFRAKIEGRSRKLRLAYQAGYNEK